MRASFHPVHQRDPFERLRASGLTPARSPSGTGKIKPSSRLLPPEARGQTAPAEPALRGPVLWLGLSLLGALGLTAFLLVLGGRLVPARTPALAPVAPAPAPAPEAPAAAPDAPGAWSEPAAPVSTAGPSPWEGRARVAEERARASAQESSLAEERARVAEARATAAEARLREVEAAAAAREAELRAELAQRDAAPPPAPAPDPSAEALAAELSAAERAANRALEESRAAWLEGAPLSRVLEGYRRVLGALERARLLRPTPDPAERDRAAAELLALLGEEGRVDLAAGCLEPFAIDLAALPPGQPPRDPWLTVEELDRPALRAALPPGTRFAPASELASLRDALRFHRDYGLRITVRSRIEGGRVLLSGVSLRLEDRIRGATSASIELALPEEPALRSLEASPEGPRLAPFTRAGGLERAGLVKELEEAARRLLGQALGRLRDR